MKLTTPRTDSWIRIGLVVAAIAPFVGTLFYGFVYDNHAIVLQNRVLVGWKSVFEVWRHPLLGRRKTRDAGVVSPAAHAVLRDPGERRAQVRDRLPPFAVALHAAATLLVAKLLRRGVGRWPATGAALWFALHPVHVEAVASVANVSEVLVCVWAILLTLWLLPPRESSDGRFGAPGWGKAVVAALLYAAALFSKESGGVAPGLALLAVAAWGKPGTFSARDARTRAIGWARVVTLWLVVLASVVVIRQLVLGGVTGRGAFAIPGLAELDAPHRIVAVFSTGVHVMQLLLWTTQSPNYGPTALLIGIEGWLAAGATALTILLLLLWSSRLAFRSDRRDARPFVGVVWCLLAYFPASNLVAATGAIIAERTLYLASVGVAMLLAWCLEQVLAYAAARLDSPARATS